MTTAMVEDPLLLLQQSKPVATATSPIAVVTVVAGVWWPPVASCASGDGEHFFDAGEHRCRCPAGFKT